MLKYYGMNTLFIAITNGLALGFVVYGAQVAGFVPYV
jgi:hypothetical protein